MSAPTPDPVLPETGPAATAPPVEPAAPSDPPADPKPTETVDFWKQKAREQEARAKSNAEAARKLKEIEDRDKSELQRAQEAATAAAAELAELQRQNAFLANGIPADLIPPASASAADLTEYAAKLAARLNAAAPAAPRAPLPDAGQGPRPTDQKAAEDAAFDAYDKAFFNPTRR